MNIYDVTCDMDEFVYVGTECMYENICPLDFLSYLWMEASRFCHHLQFSLKMATS